MALFADGSEEVDEGIPTPPRTTEQRRYGFTTPKPDDSQNLQSRGAPLSPRSTGGKLLLPAIIPKLGQ